MDAPPQPIAAVKSEIKTEYAEEVGELPQTNIIEIERTDEENGEVQTVVLQNIQIEDSGGDQLAFIGKIISQTNSNGNFHINSVDENSVIRTYIINNTQYEAVEGEDIYYEELEDDENSIEYVIEEAVEYEEATDENIEYTELTTLTDEYEFHDDIEDQTIDDPDVHEDISEEDVQEVKAVEQTTDKQTGQRDIVTLADLVSQKEGNVDEDSIKVECDLCSKSFRTPAGLKRHITVNHEKHDDAEGDDPLTLKLCACCGEPYDTAHKSGEYKCNLCDKLFAQVNFYKRHISIEHPKDGKYICIECKAELVTKEQLLDHLRFHPIKSVKCKECNKEFTRKYHLDRHIGQTGCMGEPRKVFECRVCKRCFTRRDNLAEHLRNHAGQAKKKKKFNCEYCNKEFQGLNLLNIHVRTHTGEKPFQCDLCPKSFPSSGAMKKHRRMHTGEKPYRCYECDRTFAAKETLNRHYRTHTGERPHKCQFCGKSFIQPSQLRAHIFHHTGENAYTCQYCGRAFNRNLRLTTHIKFMHEGAEPLPCSQCEKTFFRKEDVARHMLSHSGERPFVCEVCNKGFAVKSSLKIHMNIHRKEQPCSCETCGRAFIRRDCLMRHIRARHRDVLEDILASAEKKRLQQQLLEAVTTSPMTMTENIVWNELTLTESVKELLTVLVDEECLTEFGYPDAPVDRVLNSVIRRCGHTPASEEDFDYLGRIRENAKLLFTAVIDDDAVKELLNNQTVDEVIVHVLRLAKKQQEQQD